MNRNSQTILNYHRYLPKRLNWGQISLRTIFTVPYVALIILTVVSIGYISFLNGQAAVNNVAHQLRSQISLRIDQHLLTFLEMPHQITQFNADAIRYGWLDPNNVGLMQQYFLEQVQIYPSISSIYFGNTNGGIVGSGRDGTAGPLYSYSTDNLLSGTFKKYRVNNLGNTQTLLTTVPNFDARTRPWYSNAVQKGDAIWSSVYVLITGQDMAIAASRPVYDENHNLLGVVSVDIFLSQLNNFLETLDLPSTGQSFIIERSGLLVAASTGESLFTDKNGSGGLTRIDVHDTKSRVIRQSAEFFTETFGDYHNIPPEQQQFELTAAGERQFLQVLSVQSQSSLDWMVVVAVPESVFMAQIDANNQLTLGIIMAALIASIVIGVFVTEKITSPLSQLNQSTQALAQGQWNHVLDVNSWIDELNGLASSFNQMKDQLHRTLENLTTEINERQQAEDALRKSEEKFRTMFATIGDCIIISGIQDGRILECNGKLVGYTREEMVGKTVSELGLWTKPTNRQLLIREIQAQSHVEDFENVFQRKDGTTFIGSVSANLIPMDHESYLLSVTRDITARKQIQEELEHYQNHLEELVEQRTAELRIANEHLLILSRMKDEFVSNVSHELRTPIASLKLRHFLLAQHPDQVDRHLGVIKREIDRLGQTIEDLLQLSRMDQGRTELSRSPVDLNVLIAQYVSDRTPIATQKQLSIAFSGTPESPKVLADAGLLGQVMSILLTNAINYTPEGGQVTVSTHFREDASQRWAGFSISDNGPGISPEEQSRLFTRFFRGTAGRKFPGTGLGLAIAKQIVDRHQGHIEVASDGVPGQGTTFSVWILTEEKNNG